MKDDDLIQAYEDARYLLVLAAAKCPGTGPAFMKVWHAIMYLDAEFKPIIEAKLAEAEAQQ